MKSCSHCHFTFDDHVQVCDFDGTVLEPYPEPTREVKLLFEGPRLLRLFRNRAFQATLTLFGIVSSALLIGYYDAVSQSNLDQQKNARGGETSASPVPIAHVSGNHPAQIVTNSFVANSRAFQLPRGFRAYRKSGVEPRASRPLGARSADTATEPRRLRPTTLMNPGLPVKLDNRAPLESRTSRPPNLEASTSRPPRAQGATLSPPIAEPTAQIAGNAWPTSSQLPRSPALEQPTSAAELDEASTPTLILKKTGKVIKKTVGILKRPFTH